ncbi:MAG: hypothetical protein AB7I30_03635 [Isosphaeraceae bacterium]
MPELNRRELLRISSGGALLAGVPDLPGDAPREGAPAARKEFAIPRDYLREVEDVPEFWVSTYAEVTRFLDARVRKGTVREIGRSAGDRSIRAVVHGRPRSTEGTTTFSGSLGYGDVRAWIGPDYEKRVYLAMGSVHGGEFEGIVGLVNLIAVLETGSDLRGRPWPEITKAAAALDRIILIPILNVDGRSRVPIRMGAHRGTDFTVAEYFNTGGQPDGSLIGWPQCKEFIPLDFATTQFPGGYPNDAGVNVQHDDFFGRPQPETRALLDLAATERPDLTMNMHTGATFVHPLRSVIEPALNPSFEALYRRIMTRLTTAGLQASDDPAVEADPARERPSVFNLDSALNYHCGSLSMLIESPSHTFSTGKRNGEPFAHTPDRLLDAQLICHQEAMGFLAETGGRWRWTPNPNSKWKPRTQTEGAQR